MQTTSLLSRIVGEYRVRCLCLAFVFFPFVAELKVIENFRDTAAPIRISLSAFYAGNFRITTGVPILFLFVLTARNIVFLYNFGLSHAKSPKRI
jgi:hypothetical protein